MTSGQDLDSRAPGLSSLTSYRVLVAEDDPAVRAVTVRALRGAGFQVLHAENGRKALVVLMNEPIDVLVTDVMMPELSGPELVREARSMLPGLPVVFVSGYPEALRDAAPGEFPGAEFLAKPFSPGELVEKVVRQCRAHAALRSG